MADQREISRAHDEATSDQSAPWNFMYDQQVSDDDDDEPRLMIDTSGDDEESSASQSSDVRRYPMPLEHMTPLFLHPSKAAKLRPPPVDDDPYDLSEVLRGIQLRPELEDTLNRVTINMQKKGFIKQAAPGSSQRSVSNVAATPEFQKAIFEMEMEPDLKEALDKVLQLSHARAGKSSGVRKPKFLKKGCDRTTQESTASVGVGVNPLTQLQAFVQKRDMPLHHTTISITPITGNEPVSATPIRDIQGMCVLILICVNLPTFPAKILAIMTILSSSDEKRIFGSFVHFHENF